MAWSYWLCEFVRHHGGEKLLDNLRALSAAGRLRQVLQRLVEVQTKLWLCFWKQVNMKGTRNADDVFWPHTWWCWGSAARRCVCASRCPFSAPSGLWGVWTPEEHTGKQKCHRPDELFFELTTENKEESEKIYLIVAEHCSVSIFPENKKKAHVSICFWGLSQWRLWCLKYFYTR